MESLVKEKINIGELISDSIYVYKSNFKALMTLSIISVILASFYTAVLGITDTSIISNNMEIKMILIMIGGIIGFVFALYNIRVTAAMELSVRNTYKDEKVSARESYRMAEGLIGKIFITSICVGLMLSIPMILVGVGMALEGGLILRVSVILAGAISGFIIIVKYGFSTVIAALYPELDSYYARSSNLVKGNFKEVAIIVLLANIANILVIVISELVKNIVLSLASKALISIVTNLIMAFITPFQMCIIVIAILKLTKIFLEDEKADIQLSNEA